MKKLPFVTKEQIEEFKAEMKNERLNLKLHVAYNYSARKQHPKK